MYFNKEYFKALAPRIRMNEDELSCLLQLMPALTAEEGEAAARFLTDDAVPYTEKKERILEIAARENGDLLCVLIYMAAAGYTHEKYKAKGIPDEIFYNTFNCLPEKMETNMHFFGKYGYASPTWPLSHLNMTLFRIGRLGYAFVPDIEEPLYAGDKVLVEKGDSYIYMHISDNEKLVGCAESILEARAFFRKFYPKYGDCVYMTNTWLLDPRLGEILSPTSNIMQFQSLFEIYDRYDCRTEVLKRTFGEEREDLNSYTPTTSLSRAVLAYLQSGKELGRGLGYAKS